MALSEAELLANEEKRLREKISTAAGQVVREKARLGKLVENRRYLRNEASIVDLDQFRLLQREITKLEEVIGVAESVGKKTAKDLKVVEAKQKLLASRTGKPDSR